MKSINPWNQIELSDYENHMSADNVMQLQILSEIMKSQLLDYGIRSVCILGIAGGNGLEHIIPSGISEVYGVDINISYLEACKERYPQLKDIFHPILCDLSSDVRPLRVSELLVANLLIEYIGYDNFSRAVQQVNPHFVSCVIQEDSAESFVSETKYAVKLSSLDRIHNSVSRMELKKSLGKIGYEFVGENEIRLPNKKKLVRLDFKMLHLPSPGRASL